MSDMLSQEQINALLAGNNNDEEEILKKSKRGRKKKSVVDDESHKESDKVVLTDLDKDVLGEVGNISMGSASTALSNMIGKKVNITTPVISVTTLKKLRESFEVPNIALEIKYVTGIIGKNILLMRVCDAAIVANLMMGGTGEVTSPTLSEIEESAVSEAMNQMMGSAATSMATMFARKVDISPPKSRIWDAMTSSMSDDIEEDEDVIQVAFKLNIENLVDSVIMQVLSIETAQKIISIMMGTENNDQPECKTIDDSITADIMIESKQDAVEKIKEQAVVMSQPETKTEEKTEIGTNSYSLDYGSSDYKIQKVEYKQFSDSEQLSKNTNSVLDVPLNIQVVLGNAQRSIKEILNFNNGTLLELNQVADQPVELQINGKVIAYGEVVLVNGNLAIHITDINKNNI